MSAAVAAAAAAALSSRRSATPSSRSVQNSHQYHHHHNLHFYRSFSGLELSAPAPPTMGRYESQKRRDWNSFVQYLKTHHDPSLKLSCCDGYHVVEFLRYLSQTKIQASFDALIGRLRVAFEENGGPPETNPFCSRVVKLYLEEVKNGQAKSLA